MAVRPRFSSVCIFIVVLEWASAAAASSPGAVAGPRALNAAGSHHGSTSVEPTGPPPNLQSGVFRSVVHTMWQASPTFKQQCRRLAMAPGLVVRLLVDSSRGHSNLRAWTEMSRRDGALSNARVVILSPPDSTELIAHEIEHVIEQLDGVDVRDRRSSTTTHAAGVAYESDRAAHVGRVVAREVRESRGRVVMSLPQRDQPGGQLDPASASISADGRFVAFTSGVRLAPADEDDDLDLYVQDLQTGTTTLESPSPGWASRYHPILYPRISVWGRFIVFQAVVEDGPPSFPWQVVVLDRRDQSARVASVDAQGRLANGHCTQAAISADGTTIVFESLATNLIESGDANGSSADILMVRVSGGAVTRVNVASDGSQPVAGHSVTPAVSADGRYVAFTSTADLLCPGGQLCDAAPRGRKRVPEIYRRDTADGVTSRVSRSSIGADPNGPSSWPAISGDGRYVAFVSDATNLARGDRNARTDVFLHDTSTGTTELVSRRPDGRAANGASSLPAISGDGQTIAFQSLASDLVCTKDCASLLDINLLSDLFVHDRLSGTTVRASVEGGSEWMASSRAPSLDTSGRILVFASRHPTGSEDLQNDDDLFVWVRGRTATMPAQNRRN